MVVLVFGIAWIRDPVRATLYQGRRGDCIPSWMVGSARTFLHKDFWRPSDVPAHKESHQTKAVCRRAKSRVEDGLGAQGKECSSQVESFERFRSGEVILRFSFAVEAFLGCVGVREEKRDDEENHPFIPVFILSRSAPRHCCGHKLSQGGTCRLHVLVQVNVTAKGAPGQNSIQNGIISWTVLPTRVLKRKVRAVFGPGFECEAGPPTRPVHLVTATTLGVSVAVASLDDSPFGSNVIRHVDEWWKEANH